MSNTRLDKEVSALVQSKSINGSCERSKVHFRGNGPTDTSVEIQEINGHKIMTTHEICIGQEIKVTSF